MITTEKRITLNLSKEDIRLLKMIIEHTGENTATVLKKALFFYQLYYLEKQKEL